MPVYELGATVTLSHSAGSGATVTLLVTAPDGTESTPTPTFAGSTWSANVTASQYDTWLYAWVVDGTAVEVGSFVVGGPWYTTLAQLRASINVPASNTTHDTGLAARLTAAARAVEKYCDSRPKGAFLLDSSTSVRLYRPARKGPAVPGVVEVVELGGTCYERLYVRDIGHATFTVETSDDGATWSTLTEGTDFETWPDNAIVEDQAVTALTSDDEWPSRVRVTARWGWPEVPSSVSEATLLQASRLYRRKDSPEGVAGSSDWGLIRVPNLDPDVKALLSWLRTDALVA